MITKFLLLLGPSGVGKTTLIHCLKAMDKRFIYISPYTNRKLRAGEADKIHTTDSELDKMEHEGKLLTINHIYGIRYATPRKPIEDALKQEKFPLLDWPVERVQIMQNAFPKRLFCVYLEPPSLEILKSRLTKDGRDTHEDRFVSAVRELESLHRGDYKHLIDYHLITYDKQDEIIAYLIYTAYLEEVGNK